MSAGLAPPMTILRLAIALAVAFALAVVLPSASTVAHASTAVASDDDGDKKKDKSDRKSDNRDKSSKDDDEDDEDDDDARSSKSRKSDDDDSDDNDSDDDDAEDDDDDAEDDDAAEDDDDDRAVLARVSDDSSRGSELPVQATEPAPKPDTAAPAAPVTATATAGSLLASGAYLPMADAIARARKAGGQGDVLQIDLEYDAFRGFATCDVTFSSGTEYEMNAETGEVLGEKQKDPRKLALLAALSTDAKDLKAFTDIIDQVVKATGQAVLEMELKHLKGQPGVVFEVVTADGITSHFDAVTGKPAAGV